MEVCCLRVPPQNNVYSYSMAANVKAIRQLKFELFSHPLYSADLGPSDYYMFGTLREALHGWKTCQLWWNVGHFAYGALITTENLLWMWDQNTCEPLHSMLWKKELIMLRNDTVCVDYRVSTHINFSLSFLTVSCIYKYYFH